MVRRGRIAAKIAYALNLPDSAALRRWDCGLTEGRACGYLLCREIHSQKIMLAQIIAVAKPTAARSLRRWFFHLGGVGLIPLGIIDSSVIPIPGSVDVVTIILSSRQGDWWPYYAFMATLGSVVGGVLTYRLARKGGKETLERKLSGRQSKKAYEIFERWGFGTLAVSSLLPPPAPMVPFLLAAGAMQYPLRKFLSALTLGRAVRYTVLAYLAARYGRYVIKFVTGHPVTWVVIGLLLATALAFVFFLFLRRGGSRRQTAS
jgi:membrane protein YqaA with SNARE-associated domain